MPGIHQRSNANSAEIDRERPYQVALPDDFCCMENFKPLAAFAEGFGYKVQTKGVRAVWEDGSEETMRLYCFRSTEDAAAFASHFEGELFEPRKVYGPRRHRGTWRREGPMPIRERYGPLAMPKFFRENP